MFRKDFRQPPFRVLAVACGILTTSTVGVAQDAPGDQLLTFGFSTKLGANDNIRLDPDSVGTTVYSDTTLSFGFSSETRNQTLDFAAAGVLRVVNDPTIGVDSGFRDPVVDLVYVLENANSRLTLLANYQRPDLAFLDPLDQAEIDDQDLFRGGGTREEYVAGVRLETGLQGPLGFEVGLDSRSRRYFDTTDPLLFQNRTDTADMAAIFRFSSVTTGRLDFSNEHYTAEDTVQTDRVTRDLTFDLSHEISAVTAVSLSFGYSDVTETFDTLPGVENVTQGPIGAISIVRLVPNGSVSASLDTIISDVGRQTTLEFGRVFDLPINGLEISFGVTDGDNVDPQPVGSINYIAELPNGSLTTELSREVSVSPTLSQSQVTTRADVSYQLAVNEVSSIGLSFYYAQIDLIGNGLSGLGRERASLNASYTRDITEDWDFVAGYEYRYFSPDTGASSRSNAIYFTLQRDFDMFR